MWWYGNDDNVGSKTSLDLDFSLSWFWAMYKVCGTFIFVPGLDLGTSGLEPNGGGGGGVRWW